MLGLGLALHKNNIPQKNIIRDKLAFWIDGRDLKNSPPTTFLMDKSGNGNNATCSGFAYTVLSGSDENGSIVFDGVDDKLTNINGNTFNENTGCTIEFSINPTILNASQPNILASTNTNSGVRAYLRNTPGSDVGFYCNLNGTKFTAVSGTINYNAKNYIQLTFDGTKMQFIINNVKTTVTATNGGAYAKDWSSIQIGSLNLSCKLFNCKIYNKVLTDAELLNNYNLSK